MLVVLSQITKNWWWLCANKFGNWRWIIRSIIHSKFEAHDRALPYPFGSSTNKSPTLQRSFLEIWLRVLIVVFCAPLSRRDKVARLIPSFRENSSCVFLPLLALRFAASFSVKSMTRKGSLMLYTYVQSYSRRMYTYGNHQKLLRLIFSRIYFKKRRVVTKAICNLGGEW